MSNQKYLPFNPEKSPEQPFLNQFGDPSYSLGIDGLEIDPARTVSLKLYGQSEHDLHRIAAHIGQAMQAGSALPATQVELTKIRTQPAGVFGHVQLTPAPPMDGDAHLRTVFDFSMAAIEAIGSARLIGRENVEASLKLLNEVFSHG